MHLPDHMLDAPSSIAAGVVACAVVAHAARRARPDLSGPRVALTAATGAAVFALQMVTYPVAPGVSGHLMGGALAAALVGPWLAILTVTAVLVVQATVFADGGLAALGANTLLMAVVGVAVGWFVTRAVQRRAAHASAARSLPAVAAGAAASVVASAAAFVALHAVGGTSPAPLGALASTAVGVHALIGAGEAVLTAAVLALVLALAPGAAHLDPRPAAAGLPARRAVVVLAGVAVVGGGALSGVAAATPDGLESTAERLGLLGTAAHALARLPLADYGAASGTPVGVAGLVGAALVGALLGAALLSGRAARRPGRPSPAPAPAAT